jgi:hypothetical protein
MSVGRAMRNELPPFLRTHCTALLGVLTCSLALANPLKTDKGNPVENWVFFPNGVTVPIFGQILPPGSAQEDGTGPPGKVKRFIPEPEPDAAQQAKIIADDRAAHPSIPAAGNSPPTNSYDCHGLTFKGKKLWIDDDQVDKILTDQEWKAPADGKAKVGDIVVYRKAGKVTHTGVVTMVDQNGMVTQVLSKWGARGDYKHAPDDVPASYGTFEVRTGGKPLADPDLTPEDVNVFGGHQPPAPKPWVYDPNINPDAPTNRNTKPAPLFDELTHGPTQWGYGLELPVQGLRIDPGDKIDLFGNMWTGGLVSGLASLAQYGGWQVGPSTPDSIDFIATAFAMLPADQPLLISGFTGITSPAMVGEIVYTESTVGSIGLVSGPSVPEPASLVLLAIAGVGGLMLVRRRA